VQSTIPWNGNGGILCQAGDGSNHYTGDTACNGGFTNPGGETPTGNIRATPASAPTKTTQWQL